MDLHIIVEAVPQLEDNIIPSKKKISFQSILNKFLFFLLGSSVTCLGSTGRLTSKAFGTADFISDCFSVYIYLNLAAFLVVLLFIKCSYRKAIISGWLCLMLHVSYILIVLLSSGNLAKGLYISVYGGIAILEAFLIQSNSFVVSEYYSPSLFSNLYSGYYGGLGIFSLIQTIFQRAVGTNTPKQAKICLLLTHGSFTIIVFCAVIAQSIIYFKNRVDLSPIYAPTKSSWVTKIKGMYRVFLSLPKYSSRFLVFILSDLCKCAFFQVFIPYRMLLNDSQLAIVFFVDNFSDIIGRSIASSTNDTVVTKGTVTNHQKFLYKRDLPYLLIPCFSWVICFLVVWGTWTLKSRFLTEFMTILFTTLLVCFSMGYCSTKGVNGCIPVLEYYKNIGTGGKSRLVDEKNYSYVNDLNNFLIKFLWMVFFIVVYFLAQIMERYQATDHYQHLKTLL
ncbi:uncharacterized protein TA15965 [Theileria annulata]|uniref:Uncharacterized protein n=1 Tax=Theileria annulata TaxID=5874 RepID=Q4UFS4_THEAN|nr:uncharacterized protein TA15965 [Theileria annulata]CAI74042.1 hypothetical protein TA15965 [Theileria annulata]|eukprot:XP_951774.1 hypothetical protein TA15965 [Theileria annulata]